MIFALPPSEIAVHPAATGGSESLYLMCDDLDATVAALAERGIACEASKDESQGRISIRPARRRQRQASPGACATQPDRDLT